MANLSLAIPQGGWFFVFSEVRRILASDGRLEVIDDQILFPYDKSPLQTPLSTSQLSPHSKNPSSFDVDSEGISNRNLPSTPVDECPHSMDQPQAMSSQSFPKIDPVEWEAHAQNSKGLETIFEGMLLKKYGIHPRPQDIIDVVLSHVFGHKHADQIKSMHLALAPTDLAESVRAANRVSMIGPEVGGMIQLISGQSGDGLADAEVQLTNEMECDPTKPEQPRRPNHTVTLDQGTISPKAANRLGIAIPDRTSGEGGRLIQFQLPEIVGAKTVGRLKMYQIYPSMKWKGKWSESIRSRRASMESFHADIPETISPKAAERLGIASSDRESWGSQRSQSGELMNSDHSSGDRSCRESIVQDMDGKSTDRSRPSSSLPTTQSPGLILWPSTFIPIEPLELEMHACKHMHVLLGCKAALSDFIQEVKGADGQAHVSQGELNDLTWEYEWCVSIILAHRSCSELISQLPSQTIQLARGAPKLSHCLFTSP
jgi:hypothetical protein